MCVYKGDWQVNTQVTADGRPLPMLQEPGLGTDFGWGGFSPWASQKLLAYSIMNHELGTIMALPKPIAYRYALLLGDFFVEQRVAKLDKQWSMTSEDIAAWAKQYHPDLWGQLTRGRAMV